MGGDIPSPEDTLLGRGWLLRAAARLAPHCPPWWTQPQFHLHTVGSAQPRPDGLRLRHPPGRDELQQPVGPDLFDAPMGHGAHVGQVELLVPAEVVLVSLVVWQWGAGDRRRMWGHRYLWGTPTEQPHPTPHTGKAGAWPRHTAWGVSASALHCLRRNKVTSKVRNAMKSHGLGDRGPSEERGLHPHPAPCLTSGRPELEA